MEIEIGNISYKVGDIILLKNRPHINPYIHNKKDGWTKADFSNQLIGDREGDITTWRICDIDEDYMGLSPFYEGMTFPWNHQSEPLSEFFPFEDSNKIIGKIERDPESEYFGESFDFSKYFEKFDYSKYKGPDPDDNRKRFQNTGDSLMIF